MGPLSIVPRCRIRCGNWQNFLKFNKLLLITSLCLASPLLPLSVTASHFDTAHTGGCMVSWLMKEEEEVLIHNYGMELMGVEVLTVVWK